MNTCKSSEMHGPGVERVQGAVLNSWLKSQALPSENNLYTSCPQNFTRLVRCGLCSAVHTSSTSASVCSLLAGVVTVSHRAQHSLGQVDLALSWREPSGPTGLPDPAPGQSCRERGWGGQQAEWCGPSQLSCQTGLPRRSQTSGTGLTNYPGTPSAVWGSCEGECM